MEWWIEWIQSFDGVMSLSFGGLSVLSIVGVVFTVYKQVKSAGSLKEVLEGLKEAKKTIEELTLENQHKDEEIQKNRLEKQNTDEAQAFIMKSLAIIITASSGVDSLTKIQLSQDIKTFAENSKNRTIEKAKETIREVKEKAEVKVNEVYKETINDVLKITEKYSK